MAGIGPSCGNVGRVPYRAEEFGRLFAESFREKGAGVDDGVEEVVLRLPVEGRLPHQHLEQQHPE